MQPLFAIPASHQKGCTLPGLNVNTKRGAPRPGEEYPPESKEHKVSRMKLQYNTALVEGDSREALGKSMLSGLQDGEGNFKKKSGQHPADDEALAWMRNERKRADDRAEKRWRAKFQEWARNTGEENEGMSHSASAPSLRRPGAGGKGPLAAGDELVKAARELRNLRRSLAEEREKLEDTQRSLEDMETDRNAWRLRTAQLEDHLSQVLAEKHGTKQKVAELGRCLCDISGEVIASGQAGFSARSAARASPLGRRRQPRSRRRRRRGNRSSSRRRRLPPPWRRRAPRPRLRLRPRLRRRQRRAPRKSWTLRVPPRSARWRRRQPTRTDHASWTR